VIVVLAAPLFDVSSYMTAMLSRSSFPAASLAVSVIVLMPL